MLLPVPLISLLVSFVVSIMDWCQVSSWKGDVMGRLYPRLLKLILWLMCSNESPVCVLLIAVVFVNLQQTLRAHFSHICLIY
jgi:hypothetical protein